MGRKSLHTPDVLRRMIIEAAEAIVAEGGLAQLSAREIAKRINYSAGTIYNVFQNLDDVVLTVEGRVLDRLARHLRQVSDGDPTDHVVRLAHAYIAFTHANPHLWNLLFEHTLPAGHDLPKWYMDKLNGLLAVIERALEPFFKSGDGEARGRAARVLWSSVHGITSLSTSGKLSIITSEAAPQLAADLVMAYLAGLKSKRKGSSRA